VCPERLDPLLQLGIRKIVRGNTYVVWGSSGSGKTLFSILAALSRTALGERVLFATRLAEGAGRLKTLSKAHGLTEEMLERIITLDIDSKNTEAALIEITRQGLSSTVIVDTITASYLTYVSENPELLFQRNRLLASFLAELHYYRRNENLLLIFTADSGQEPRDQPIAGHVLNYFADMTIHLRKKDMTNSGEAYIREMGGADTTRYSYTMDYLGFNSGGNR
jgi:hypothetical protein